MYKCWWHSRCYQAVHLSPSSTCSKIVLAAINHKASRKGPRTSLNLLRNDNGNNETIGPRSSSLYIFYIVSPQLSDVQLIRKCGYRFRFSYESFLKLLERTTKEELLFQRYWKSDAFGKICSAIELLLHKGIGSE